MSDWDYVESGFNAADETINFGSRSFAALDNLYEITTLASLKNSEEGSYEQPNINALVKNGSIFFSINKTVRVFKDFSCSAFSFNATFEEQIDVFCVTSDAKYLLLCLRSGTVYCFNIGNDRAVIYAERILENDKMDEPFFLNTFVENDSFMMSFILVLRNGKIYRIACSNFSSVNDNSESPSFEFTFNLLADLECIIHTAAFKNPLLCVTGEEFCTLNVETNEIFSDDTICNLKKLFSCNTRMFLGLDNDGCIINICANTFLTYFANTVILFEDILLINGSGGSHILGVTKNKELGHSYLQLMSYPDYSTIFSLKITERIHLITPEHIHDDIIYVSELKHDKQVSELRFQVVSETAPENRLKRLLRRKKFEEAEQFAKLFHLDLLEIQKAKAQVIVDKTNCDESDVGSLLNILNSIHDDVFKIQSCLDTHSSCNRLEDVKRVLSYGCAIDVSKSDKDLYKNVQYRQDLLAELLFRFDTFLALVMRGRGKSSIQDWIDFSVCNIIEELSRTLENHHVEESIIIYSRLDTKTISELNEENIKQILDVLSNISMEEQLPFLCTFLPLTLLYVPSSLDLLIKWIIGKVFHIEKRRPVEFPKNAIDFVNEMVRLLKVDCVTNINFQQQYATNQSSLPKLIDLLEALERLQSLKNDYRIVIPLQQFLQQKETLIETLLNTVIYSMDEEFVLEEFIRKFMFNSQLKPDEIFADIIKDIVKYAEEYWIKVVPVILNSIGSVHRKLEATLVILKSANVPWCATIRQIARNSLQYSHPLVKEIIQQIEYEPKSVVLKKHPYKLTKHYINTVDYLKFAINRMIYCNEPTMIEDIYQVCKDSKEKHEADMLLINHFIKSGNFENALQLLDNNSPEDVAECCKTLVEIGTLVIDNKFNMDSLRDNYYHILGSIFKRLKETAGEFEKSYLQEKFENLKNVYKIQKHFNIKISYNNLIDQNNKIKVLEDLVTNAVEDFEVENNLLKCIRDCEKISACLGINKSRILIKLCEQVGSFNVLLKAAENLYASESDADSLCQIVTLILKCIGSPSIYLDDSSHKSNDESFLQNFKNIDLKVFISGLKLARKIVVKAILICHRNDVQLGNCIELANWIETTHYLTQDDVKYFSPNLRNTYGTDVILPSISVLNGVKNVFHFYEKIMSGCNNPNTRYLNYFNHDVPELSEVQRTVEIYSLQSTVKCLCTEGHSLTAYKLIRILQKGLLYNSHVNSDVNENLLKILNETTKQLLQNVFATRYIDRDLSYNLLLSCDIKYSRNFLFHNLRFYKRDAGKFETIAKIYLHFLEQHGIEDQQSLCRTIILLAKWWKKIQNCQISYEVFFKKKPEDVIEKLIQVNHLNIALIEEYCLDFKLDVQVYYELYLKKLLINWKTDHVIQIDIHGKRQLIVKNSEEQLFENCMEVINVIKNVEAVCNMMKKIWDTINFYHYEVFMCILNIISKLSSSVDYNQKYLILTFFKNYNRTNKPGVREIEEWSTLYPDTQCIDFLSEWRLPFTPTLFTHKIYNIIRPELNLKTYTKWFEVISILKGKLSKNDICCYVIKEIVASGVFQSKESHEWILHPKHNDLLLEIDACILNISNVVQATSAIYCLVTNIPGGADQVNAIKLCYNYALKYKQQCPQMEDVQQAVVKVEKKYFSYSATHILYTNKLADKKYLKLVSHPVDELIAALYMDDRILKKAAFVTLHCPDINKAVDELAELHNINIQEKRFTLLDSWFSSNARIADFNLDMSMCGAPCLDNRSKSNPDIQCDNLVRASYVCTSGDKTVWRNWLLKLGYVETSESRNLCFKANALKCFCNISDIETIENLTDTTYAEFRNYINKLMLISGLECFGFSLTIESLDKYNKKDLLKRLAYHITSPIGVKTMASVCATYTIYESKYWMVIINALLKLNMIQELKECVNFLRKTITFQNKQFYIEAWQTVINNSFNLKANMTEEELKCFCIDNFYLIQSCPVLFTLDLEYVVKKCMELKRFDFAALVVQYLPKEKQIIYAKEILKADKNVCKKVEEFVKIGFWGISYIKNLLMESDR